MIFNSLIVISLSGFVLGSPFWSSIGQDRIHGSLAREGAVGFKPEFELANAAQQATFELEHQRLKNVLAANHPDLIPHLSGDSYTSNIYERGQHTYDNGEYNPERYELEFNGYTDDDRDEGQYDPKLYEEYYFSQHDDGQYKPHVYNKGNDYSTHYDDGNYRPNLYQQSQFHSPAYRPATLNSDGTVAHTPEYKAIAASFLAAYKKALSRHRRSTERYQGPSAPLNQDFTVDYTPEVKHFNAAHFTAVANQFKRLQETAALAAAHPDLTSPPSKDYNPQNNHYIAHNSAGVKSYPHFTPQLHHSKYYNDGQYRPHLYEQGHYPPHGHGTFHRHRRSLERYEGPPAPLNPDFTVDFTPEIKKIHEAHFSAIANQLKRLQATAELAAAHPDRTSPPSSGNQQQSSVSFS